MTEAKLPKKDWVLLPLLGVITMCVIVAGFRSIAGSMFPKTGTTTGSCMIVDDRSTGTRAIPNTVCMTQNYEAGETEYRYNSCGHRTGMECGPKPAGTYRIVMIGSSFNFGMWVPREKTFAALLPDALSSETGRSIQVYNESMLGGWPRSAALRLREVFAEQPDMVLWVLSPRDIRNASKVLLADLNPSPKAAANAPAAIRGAGLLARIRYRIGASLAGNSLPEAASIAWTRFVDWSISSLMKSPSGILLQHILYSSRTQYLKSYLVAPEADDDGTDPGYLRVTPSEKWRGYVQQFDARAAEIEDKLHAAGVPLVAVLVPDRAQAALISMGGAWPAGIDPYQLGDEVKSIITRHGGTYVDILPDFRTLPNPERDYFPVDGHPDEHGHATIARLLTRALLRGDVPALRVDGK